MAKAFAVICDAWLIQQKSHHKSTAKSTKISIKKHGTHQILKMHYSN